MMTENKSRQKILIPPPVLYLCAFADGILLNYFFPVDIIPLYWKCIMGSVLIGCGCVLGYYTSREFHKHRISVRHGKPPEWLITTGPFRFTRNPLYMVMNLLLTGIGFASGNIWTIAMVVPTILVMNWLVIRIEEKYLEDRFGNMYKEYKKKVRRWM